MNAPPLSTGPLRGVRVLEVGAMVAAPYAARLLADLGADVIKVEPPAGDLARSRGPFAGTPDPNASGLFLALNTNKRSVVIDPDEADAVTQRLEPLLASCDILLVNVTEAELASLTLDLNELHRQRPELVIVRISPFGATGPYSTYQAEELTVSHASGWAYQTPGASSEDDQPPLKIAGHQTEFQAGLAAATIAMASFHRAVETGVGDLVDFSTMAHVAGMLEAALISASYMGENPSRLGSRLLNPWKIFQAADGLVFLVTVEQDQWERLVEFMGTPEWTQLGLFDTLPQRLENEDLLVLYIEEWTAQHTVEELWREGQARRICFAPVLTMADMDGQPHLEERGFFHRIEHPVAGDVRHLGHPFRWTGTLSSRIDGPDVRGPIAPAPLLDPGSTPAFDAVDQDERVVALDPPRPSTDRPLEGIRVVDLSWVWAGPYCGMHLAFLGAEVIKIESSLRPGLGRRLPLHPPDVEPSLNTSAYFNQWDQAKLSVDLDLADPGSLAKVKTLIAECDVVLENFATGVMDKLGLGYDVLRELNPQVIVASVSGYGSTGRYARYMGYGPTTGPLSGLSSLTGYTGGAPRELGIAAGDPTSGITAAFAICAALVARRRTGHGAYLDVSLWESMAVCASEGWMGYALTGTQPERDGNHDPLMAPHNCYPAAGDDEWVSIACRDDEAWQAFAAVVDGDCGSALAEDARFADLAGRKTNEAALDAAVTAWTSTRDRWEITERLQAHGVAAFPSMSPLDLLADRHLEERGVFVRLDHPEVGRRTHTGPAWHSTTARTDVERPAPLMGEHSDEVLQRFGLT